MAHPLQEHTLTNSRVVYSNGDVREKKKNLHVDTLVKQGVICELKPHNKGFFSPALFVSKKKGENKNKECHRLQEIELLLRGMAL